MGYRMRLCISLFAAAALIGVSAGCARSSHTSVRISEYDDEPPRDRTMNEHPESEYEMVSPGKMVSPGEMVGD